MNQETISSPVYCTLFIVLCGKESFFFLTLFSVPALQHKAQWVVLTSPVVFLFIFRNSISCKRVLATL